MHFTTARLPDLHARLVAALAGQLEQWATAGATLSTDDARRVHEVLALLVPHLVALVCRARPSGDASVLGVVVELERCVVVFERLSGYGCGGLVEDLRRVRG